MVRVGHERRFAVRRTAEFLDGFSQFVDGWHPVAESVWRKDESAIEVADFGDAAVFNSDAGDENAGVAAGAARRKKRVAQAVFQKAGCGDRDAMYFSGESARLLKSELFGKHSTAKLIGLQKGLRETVFALREPRLQFARSGEAVRHVLRGDDRAPSKQLKIVGQG